MRIAIYDKNSINDKIPYGNENPIPQGSYSMCDLTRSACRLSIVSSQSSEVRLQIGVFKKGVKRAERKRHEPQSAY
jgi:hypothetical protein